MRTSVVLTFFLSVAKTVYGDCDRPTGGPNMILKGDVTFPVADGTQVTFECEVGYRRVGGSGTIACSAGQWSSLNMRCEIRNCGSAGEVTNGYVDYSQGTEFGAIVHVVCNDGYTVVGIENRVYCGVNGWQGRLAECEVVMCDSPNPIANGRFDPQKDEYEHSEVITYSCVGDYKLNGSRTASCHNDRQFKPAPPKCVLVNCKDPPQISNGMVASGSRPPYKHLSSVTYRCLTGHTLVGQDTVSCDINSNWSPTPPICKATECTAPKIDNGEVQDGSRPTYKFSDTIIVKCTEGYTISGESTLKCGERGQWSPAVPTCTKIQCPTPKVDGGELLNVSPQSYNYRDTVRFKCNSGYTMSGENTLTCEADGQWSPKPPYCTKVECRAPEVKDGQVVKDSRSSYKYLDSVVLECKSGYTMSGESKLTCTHSSQWSPEPPQCTQTNGGHTTGIVLGVVGGVCAIVGIGLGIFLNRKKRKHHHPVVPA